MSTLQTRKNGINFRMYRIGRVLSTRHLSNRRQRGQFDQLANSMVKVGFDLISNKKS